MTWQQTAHRIQERLASEDAGDALVTALRLAADGLLTEPASGHAGAPTALLCTDLAAAELDDVHIGGIPIGASELATEPIRVGEVRSLLEATASALRSLHPAEPSADLAATRALMHIAEALAELEGTASFVEDTWLPR